MSERTCTVEGCDRKHAARGLCMMHYKRLTKTGTLHRYGVRPDPHEGTVLKTCRKCGEAKPRSEYVRNELAADGLKGRCKACDNATLRQKYAEDARTREAVLRRMRRYKYKLEQTEIDALFALQNGTCPVCSQALGDKFDVDHCHNSNDVRGLLHRRCNLILGFFERAGRDGVEALFAYLDDPPMKRLREGI